MTRTAWLKLLFALFVVANLTVALLAARFYGGVIRGTDGQMYYAFVRSAMLDRDLDFENEFSTLTPHPEQIYEREYTDIGKLANKYTVGTAVMIAPWFVAAHLVTKLYNFIVASGGGGEALSLDGYSLFYDRFCGLGLCLYALIGAWASWTFLDQTRSRLVPLLLVFGAWFGTSAFYYAAVFPLMSHSVGLCVVALALMWARQLAETVAENSGAGETSGMLFKLTLVCTLALVVRPMNAPLLIYPAWIVLSRYRSFSPAEWVRALAGSLLLASLQVLAWRAIFGQWVLYSYKKEPFFWFSPEITNVLFSTTRGLFFWTPLTLLAICGLLVGLRQQLLPRILLVSFLLTLYLSAAWHSWWFGHAFGARQFTEYLPVFALGLWLLWELVPKLRLGWIVAGGLSLVWTLNLLALYAYARLPFQGALEMQAITPFWMHAASPAPPIAGE